MLFCGSYLYPIYQKNKVHQKTISIGDLFGRFYVNLDNLALLHQIYNWRIGTDIPINCESAYKDGRRLVIV